MSVQLAIHEILWPTHTRAMRQQARKDAKVEAAIRWLREPFKPNYPFGVFAVETPMPATQADIQQLKGLLNWARGSNIGREPKERVLADALERAIAYLEEPDSRQNVVGYVLNALHQSYRRSNGTYVVRDRDLHDWAIQQIEGMFGGPHTEEHHPHQRRSDS